MFMTKRLYRSRKNRILAGVAGGIAEYFAVDPVIVRLIFVILAFGQGSGILAYIIGWIVIPEEPSHETDDKKEEKSEPPKTNKAQSALAPSQNIQNREDRPKYMIGTMLIIIGGILLAQNLIGLHFWRLFAPLVLVGIGLVIIVRNMGEGKS
jgi:phage shock protein PspC (stress-responsive transcriptional regulator)